MVLYTVMLILEISSSEEQKQKGLTRTFKSSYLIMDFTEMSPNSSSVILVDSGFP